MAAARFARSLLCSAIVGVAVTVVAQSLPPLEILGRQGDYYWVVETAADGSRRGGWVSAQIPLDRIDRAALQPIPPTGPVQAAPPITTPAAPTPSTLSQPAPTDRTLHSRYPQTKQGFWLNVGLGPSWGQCGICLGRQAGAAFDLSLGGTINPQLLLGGGTTAWYREYGGTLGVTVGTVDARWRIYPSKTSGGFITSGLGLGIVSLTDLTSSTSVSTTGLGGVVGAGWDIRVGHNVSLTPFYSGFWLTPKTINGVDLGWITANEFGLGVTIH